MKLAQTDIEYIENVVKTSISIGIDNVIIEKDIVRAIDDARTVVMFQDQNVPDMPFGSVGLNRLGIFLQRLEIAKLQDNLTVDVGVDDDAAFAKAFTMRGDGIKIDYRTANPSTIHAPRQINDTLLYTIQLNAEAVSLLQKGHTAMGDDRVNIVSDDNGVTFVITDVNGDDMRHTFTQNVTLLDGVEDNNFTHRYPIKTLLSIFKQNPEGEFSIGSKGILKINVNGLDIFVLPQV